MLRFALTLVTKHGEISGNVHIQDLGNFMNNVWIRRTATALILSSFASFACAQYIWLNSNGKKEYSDMPPPMDVPKIRILKQPDRIITTSTTSEPASEGKDASAASNAAASKPKMPPTIAEKNADFQKRKLEQAEKEKLAADKAKAEVDKAKNCDRARAYQRNLTAGVPITSTDKNGERYYLNEAQLNQERRDNNRMLEDCK